MPLTETHLRYLFAIHECAAQHQDLSSRVLADRLGVKKPSVVRLLEVLMEKKLIVKKHYGKIYLTDRGAFSERRTITLSNIHPFHDALFQPAHRLLKALCLPFVMCSFLYDGSYLYAF